MDISKYKVTNIHRGKKSQGRDQFVYAELRDEDGELVIAATLDYIHEHIYEMTEENFVHPFRKNEVNLLPKGVPA